VRERVDAESGKGESENGTSVRIPYPAASQFGIGLRLNQGEQRLSKLVLQRVVGRAGLAGRIDSTAYDAAAANAATFVLYEDEIRSEINQFCHCVRDADRATIGVVYSGVSSH
jgi:hypothetical protein